MADVFTPTKRSEVMSRIRGKGNKATELALIVIMRRHRITGWRRNSSLPGRPDFVFPKTRVALFVDGCFWHGCPAHANLPVNNRPFWRAKLEGNRRRDRRVGRALRARGWRVLRVWEHDLKRAREPALVNRLRASLKAAPAKPGNNEWAPGSASGT